MLKMKEKYYQLSATIRGRCTMTTRQLQTQAYTEWSCSSDIKSNYHTFEFYWAERYARIYKLPARLWTVGRFFHRHSCTNTGPQLAGTG
jgi:hypothetical protein